MVLIVEDNHPFRQALREAVEASFPGLRVREAATLAQADWALQDRTPSLVLLDLALPDGNGLDWARRTKAVHPSLPVVPCTQHDADEYRDAARAIGITDFFVKQRLDWGRLHDLLETVMHDQDLSSVGGYDLDSALRGVSC